VFAGSRLAEPILISGGIAEKALRRFVERQDPEPLLAKLTAIDGVLARGEFHAGRAFTVRATPQERLQFALKLGKSIRLFFAARDAGIRLFDIGGRMRHGNELLRVTLFDAEASIVPVGGRPREQTPTLAETMIELEIAPSLESELR
jgi:hypothetical protein